MDGAEYRCDNLESTHRFPLVDGVPVLKLAGPETELIVSDVSLTSVVNVVCDAHNVPFDGETFDAVVAVAVLEHVADPQRCAQELHRVLKPRGVVFAVTPFMQQVHGGGYDFTRFTH